jgi:O-methyltransferase
MISIKTFFDPSTRRQKRKEKKKLKKIDRYSKKYGVRKCNDYNFQTSTPQNDYLDSLKQRILEEGVTMLGAHKLDTLRYCTEICLKQGIAGDIIETGVWKGGATIYFAGILKAYGNTSKKVFVADSFEGLPPPDEEKWPQDSGDKHHIREDLAISLEDVRANFEQFNLLSENVIFIKGFFEDSLRTAKIDKLSILRLDGDMYGSTMTVLRQLYHKLEIGGYLILDDWLLTGAREALLDFRSEVGIQEELYQDFSGVFWKKTMVTNPLD